MLPRVGFILKCRKIIRKKWSEAQIWPLLITRGLIFSLYKVKHQDLSISDKEKRFCRTSHSQASPASQDWRRVYAHFPSRRRSVAGATQAEERTRHIVLIPLTSLFQRNLVFYSELQFSTCCIAQEMLQIGKGGPNRETP